MTRLQAAEQAVVEAAMDWLPTTLRAQDRGVVSDLAEACFRLRDLREQLREPVCSEQTVIEVISYPYKSATIKVNCALPADHDGPHSSGFGVEYQHAWKSHK